MMRDRITLLVLCSCILLTGCAQSKFQQQSVKEEIITTTELETDGKMSDISIIQHDKELYVGDLGVEHISSPIRKGGLHAAALLDPTGFPLIKRFPSRSITPIKGSYAENVIKTAKTYLGIPYVYGSDRTEPSSFDCSDFTRWVYLTSTGMDLPWNSRSQAAYVKAFSKRIYTDLNRARRGDLLFFTRFMGTKATDYEGLQASEKPIAHMGIYLGNDKIIHSASKETGGVRIDKIKWKHLEYRFLFGGGILD